MTDGMLCPTVIGRERELVAITEALEAAQHGRGSVVLLLGEAGIGKSRLGSEAAAAAEDRAMTVLRGRAVQAASPAPFRPLAEALCGAVRVGGPPDDPTLAPFRAALGRLVPEWRIEAPDPADESAVMIGEAVLRFLRVTAGERGALLVLEDLHWADPESLVVLEYLADNLTGEPAICVATLRVEEPTPALMLAERLRARRACPVLDLARLGEPEVELMVSACLADDEVPRDVVALAARADGNPFLVEELLATTASAGALVHDGKSWTLSGSVEPVLPMTFADSVRRRLRSLNEDDRQVLFAAAVIGRRFDWSLLHQVADVRTDRVLDALRNAIEAQIVVGDVDGEHFLFRHALTRDAVLAEILAPERAAVAARALDAIEARHPDLPGEWCELAAELAQAAGDRARATELLLRVGQHALDRGALTSAEAALDRARALARSDDPHVLAVYRTLVEVQSLAGKRQRAFEVGAMLLDLLGLDREYARERVETNLRLARAAIAATDWPAAEERLQLARVDAAEERDEAFTARIEALAAHAALGAHRPEEAVTRARAAVAAADRTGLPEVACEALEIIGRCARPQDLEEAEQAFERAYAIAEEHGLAVWRVRAMHELGTIDVLRSADAERLHEARALALSVGALATTAVIDVQIAASFTTRSETQAMLEYSRRGAALARRYGLELTYAAARAFQGHAHAYAGRRDEMQECFADAVAHGHGDPGITVIVRTGESYLALAEEDRSAALQLLTEAAERSWHSPGDQSSGPTVGMMALVRVVDEPSRITTVPDAPEWWQPVHFLGRAWLRYAEAVVLGRQGRGEEAAELVAGVDHELQGFDWYRAFGRRLVAEAAVVDGWGEPVSWLRDALLFFEGLGYERVASACRSLLRQAGAPVPRRRDGSDLVPAPLRAIGVTARELEVLSHLSEGRSNQEIAEQLFLSPRTVERHVANLAVKAGVERRAQLVAFAARHLA